MPKQKALQTKTEYRTPTFVRYGNLGQVTLSVGGMSSTADGGMGKNMTKTR
jgi:hypothetical protein